MRLVVLCGMPSEKAVLRSALPGVLVLSGTDKNNLAALVPTDATHIASCGLFGGLAPSIKVDDVVVADALVDGAGGDWLPDPDWSAAIVAAVRATTTQDGPSYPQTPDWAERATLCHWYSSGVLDQADTQVQRADLFMQTGALAIDDESFFVAQFARQRGIPFAIVRSCSDDASETLPLAMRGAIVNADGSPDLTYFLTELFEESPEMTALIPKIVMDFNSSLETLLLAAPTVLQALR